MNRILGNERAREALITAAQSTSMHHAWLIAGPQGIGKAQFARVAAERILAHGEDPSIDLIDAPLAPEHPVAHLIEAGSHPDFLKLERLPKDPEKPDVDIARSIKIDQVRALQGRLATRPARSHRRIILIDAIDDLERNGANALLKSLEEPPAGTIFFLISHAPGRLLPTIRSRCRLLRFEPLSDMLVSQIVQEKLSLDDPDELAALVRAGAGSPGRALEYAGLEISALERDMRRIIADGDRNNALRAKLSKQLSTKAAQQRYEAFLARAPSLIADAARDRSGPALQIALDAYAQARRVTSVAVPQSMDSAATVFELGGILARLAR